MADGHDRRDFLTDFLRSVARTVGELRSELDDGDEDAPAEAVEADEPDVEEATHATIPAPPARRLASVDAVRMLCRELGLDAHADAAAAAARVGLRLVPGRGDAGGSRLGGRAVVPAGFSWPTWRDEELAFLGEIRLDDVQAPELSASGRLLFFYALASRPAGLEPEETGACRVVLATDGGVPDDRPAALPETPVALSAELTLPLDLGDRLTWEETQTWQSVREDLAALQGLALEDAVGGDHALHRFLGHPDVLVDDMPLDAELVSHGISLEGGDRYVDPRAGELEAGAARWRLLLQLSRDDDLGVAFDAGERLYVWIREDDLRAGRFDGVQAFVR